jgi:ribosomal protein L11 methyltransferase
MSKSIELTVKVNPVWVEYVSGVLIEKIGCSGVVTDEKYYDDEVLTRESNGIVKGYLSFVDYSVTLNLIQGLSNDGQMLNQVQHDNKNCKLLFIDKVQNILFQEREKLISSGIKEQSLGEWTLSSIEIPDEEWAHSWKKYWHPQKISEKIVICPSWEEYKAGDDEIIINLDPGSAFGTGTHPTTRLCVQALEKILCHAELNCHAELVSTSQSHKTLKQVQGDNLKVRIADIGTGSGILAVAGIKLGADFAVGVDNDTSVISVAVENAEKNNAADKCNFYTGVASDVKGEYEIVVANILAHVLIEAMPELTPLVKQDGKLILSGIISEKSQDVQNSCIQNGLKIVEVLQEDSWVAIIAGK